MKILNANYIHIGQNFFDGMDYRYFVIRSISLFTVMKIKLIA